MTRSHAERPIAPFIHIPEGTVVRCEPQDLDELLDNLLDNGWHWARSTIRITAEEAGRDIRICIADDSPGMTERVIEDIMANGRRLDERTGGHGFGLSISQELAELHGGSLDPGRSDLGGLQVEVLLSRC